MQLASAEKLSGNVTASATTALGVAGSFAVNGLTVTITADDTLTTVRDKVNALNSGTAPSGVAASILRSGAGARLVLTASNTGINGVELTDDNAGTLQTLGFTDSTVTANITSGGLTQSNRLSSGTAAIAALLGVPLPTPSVVTVGGQTISVDFSTDSLASIAAKINAASGIATSASVVTETVGGRSFSRLQTSLAVEADTGGGAAASARTLAVLGLTKAGRGSVAQVVKSANTFTDAADANAGAATLLTDLKAAGQSLGISSGDVITLSGKRGDGTTVSQTITVGVGTTMADLLSNANSATTGFGAGSRTATASLSNGKLALTDGTAGDSQLALSISVAKGSGSTISLGAFSTDYGTVGRARQINAGTDAVFKVDDQAVTRSSNTVSDVITGVTLNLLAAESGTSVDVAVARDANSAVNGMKAFAAAYNDIRTWADVNSATGKRLAGNSTLKSMVSTLSTSLLTTVTGISGSYSSAAEAGLVRNSSGVLSVDETVFRAALASNFDDVRRLFSRMGTPSDPEVVFNTATDATQATDTPYAVVISRAATAASTTSLAFGTYVAGTDDTMAITDVASGNSGSIALANGDTVATVVAKLNNAFTANRMSLVATETGGAVKITASEYGTTGGFSVAYTPGSADGTAALGIAATSFAGLDVAGTIGGVAATGSGRTLTGAIGSAVEGMQLTYLGSTARTAGSVAFSIGVGGMLHIAAAAIALDGEGQAATLATNATTSAGALDFRITTAQDRVAKRRAQLIAQFVAMESAMSKAQSLATSLGSQINSLFNYNKQV
jgi:flagellar hook-associated protein 2